MRIKTIFIIFFLLLLSASAWAADAKRIFINGFTADKEVENRKRTTERIFKEGFLNAGYHIADTASIKAGLSAETLKMSVGTNNENTLKKIMASSDVDYIVYGYIRLKNNYISITAKMLDKSNEEIKLGQVKTIHMRRELADKFYDEACRLLAVYLTSDNSKDVQKFQDKMLSEERLYEMKKRQSKLAEEETEEDEKYRRKVAEFQQDRYDSIVGNNSWIRGGYNFRDVTTDSDEFNQHFKKGSQFFIEWDIPVYTKNMIGIDIVSRYTCRYFSSKKDKVNNLTDEKLSRDFEKRDRAVFDAFDFGLRIRLASYFLMTRFDIYGIGALGVNEGSFNAFYGGGLEVAFLPHVGFFIEYNQGTSSVTDLNIDIEKNAQLLVGSTLRFSLSK